MYSSAMTGGVFRDVALEAGLTDDLASGQAIWLDYDRDGYLDLYVGHFTWTLSPDATTRAMRDQLYRNNGDGAFVEVTEEAGLSVPFHPEFGGSVGGIAAGDFNDDGWPDLYVAVWGARNRLFLNDGGEGFQDATTSVIADTGVVWGTSVGDIDHDGDLDIFQASGVSQAFDPDEPVSATTPFRSLLLLNEGEGQFLNITRGAGLSGVVARDIIGTGMADIDNDGDLDLMTCSRQSPDYFLLYLNNGDGTFVDRTSQSGVRADVWNNVSFADYDLDGFLDVVFGGQGYTTVQKFGGLYRNTGNDNHYLRVELVGKESNRNGIGARLIATSGDLWQMREMLGGLGIWQHEGVAHFGLGGHTQVDRLEIRWPSGQVDVLQDIPADQKIRVIEGREEYHVVTPTVWEHTLPDSIALGATVAVEATVRPALFEAGAEIVGVHADLGPLGGPSAVPLVDLGDGSYRLEPIPLTVDGPLGWRDVSVLIEQETSLGSYWINLVKSITVVSGMDVVIYADGPGAGWRIEASSTADSDPYATDVVHGGSTAHAITLQRAGEPSSGSVTYIIEEGVDLSWYTHLSFWIYPGEADIDSLSVDIGGQAVVWPTAFSESVTLDLVGDLGLELSGDRWIEVRIPVEVLRVEPEVYLPLVDRGLGERMPFIKFSGQVTGTFYMDDLKLVAAEVPGPTAVEASGGMALPAGYALSQNYPNPFNPITTIAYALPTLSDVTLTIYALTGQKVATLVSGHRRAGHYTVVWDGSKFASGIYFYRLEVGGFVETKKMVLVR